MGVGAAGGAPGSGSSAATGGAGTGGGAGLDSGVDAAPPLADCVYVQHGEPIVLFTYSDGVNTPVLTGLSPGSAGEPARFAMGLTHEHFWHPEIRVAEVNVKPQWPDGVSVEHSMILYGIDAHAPGQMVRAENGGLALLYFHADEASPNVIPGVKFRQFDTTSWTPFGEVFVEEWADYAFSIAPGPASAQKDSEGLGYAITWRSAVSKEPGSAVSPRVAVIDSAGSMLKGPIEVAEPSKYPGVGATVAWNGASYVVASNARACSNDAPECANRLELSVLGKLGLTKTGSAAPNPGMRARTPLVRAWNGATWAAWREQLVQSKPEDDPPSIVRLSAVSSDGQLAGGIWQTQAHPDAGAELLLSDQGVLLVWGERVDPQLPPQEVGHSRLRLLQFRKTGEALQELELMTTSLTTGTAYAVLPIAEPRALLVSWTGEAKGSTSVAYLARFDCSMK